jgi:4-methyl-5(b-hydroxyethyl)-thiazole monophosphate biosynthesis
MEILVPLANGFEEIEAVTVIDVLRRAGMSVVTAGLPGSQVRGSRGIQVMADTRLEKVDPSKFDAIILVGGNPGYINLGRSNKVLDMVVKFNLDKKLIGAICAAPSILANAGILEDRAATIYPGMEREIPRPKGKRVIQDDNIITSQGPGTAMEFALKIVETVAGKDKARALKEQLVC